MGSGCTFSPKNVLQTTVCIVATLLAFAVLAWLYSMKKHPMLDYLNWRPGVRVLWEFCTSSAFRLFALATFLIGSGISVVKKSTAAYMMGVIFATAFWSAGMETPTKLLAHQVGIAKEECWNPGTFECLLNDFNRRYDIGWSRRWSPQEEVSYQTYERLRSASGPRKSQMAVPAYFAIHDRWVHQHLSELQAVVPLPTCSPIWENVVPVKNDCVYTVN